MKEYKKIMDVKQYEERARKQILIIKEIQADDVKKYDFKLERDAKKEEFFTLRVFYNGIEKSVIYNTIDVITEHIKAVKQSIIDFKIG